MFVGAAAGSQGSQASAPEGPQVAALSQSDFVLLVLLLAALFYVGVAAIYRVALGPSTRDKLQAAQHRAKRD